MSEAAAGPVQVRATVLTARRVDAYHALTLVAPAIAARFRPGQFITVAVGGPQTSMVGRRAFAVHDIRPDHGVDRDHQGRRDEDRARDWVIVRMLVNLKDEVAAAVPDREAITRWITLAKAVQ